MNNCFELTMEALSANEKFARSVVAAFVLDLNPTIEEIADIKTAVSEAVTNSVVHGYNLKGGKIKIVGQIENKQLILSIIDYGVGIKNIDEARQPFFTSKPNDDRSGMGFTVMETFMDQVVVFNNTNQSGLTVILKKVIGGKQKNI